MSQNYRTYSRRRLSPFHGTLQVVSVEGGEAESDDGRHWTLYVAHESIVSHTGLSEVRYGTWNATDGRERSRVRGTAPSRLIEEAGDRLVSALEQCANQVPFPPADHQELWMLDDDGAPLALLESTLEKASRGVAEDPVWISGTGPSKSSNEGPVDMKALAQQVRKRAGCRPQAIWVKRDAHGRGRRDDGNLIGPQIFPDLLLPAEWNDATATWRIQAYYAWQAPWLLQLHGLPRDTRRWLEQAAWRRPEEVAKGFRLYPEILDAEGLTAARVRARLMGDRQSNRPPQEVFYPCYLE